MKRLIFVRHGRAEDDSPEISDFERSLTLKGKVISRLMARKLVETALIFAGEYGIIADNVIMNSNLYYKMSLQNLPAVLSIVNEDTDVVTLFGHNPSFTQITNNLCRGGCDFIPKSGVVCISFNIMTWSEIGRNNGKMEYFLIPEKYYE
jgi:phosphohistidine phosphatase